MLLQTICANGSQLSGVVLVVVVAAAAAAAAARP